MQNEQRYLKAVVGKARRNPIAVFDIESNEWIHFEMLGFYDGENYTQFNSVSEFCDSVLLNAKFRRYWIYAHYGGKFDFQFVLAELSRRKIHYKLIMVGSKIITASIHVTSKDRVKLVDSSGILLGSLEKLAQIYKTRTQKLSGSIDFKTERVDKQNPLHRKYLEHDCKALFEVLQNFFSDTVISECNRKPTAASYAMEIFKRKLPAPVKVSSQEVQDFVRESYVGGRVEIFKMKGEKLNGYDVNSLYPYVLKTYPMPIECIGRVRNLDRFGFHRVRIKVPSVQVPVLPHRFDSKLLFPCGTFEGVFFSEEIKLAIREGARVEKYFGGVEFTQDSNFFGSFIDFFYRRRAEYPGENPINSISKLMMNSLYGKFGESEDKESLETFEGQKQIIEFHDPELFEKTGLVRVPKRRRSPHMLVHIAAAVTSWARIHMARNYYLPYSEGLYYTDTDSVFVSHALRESSDIGGLKREHDGTRAVFRLPKAYILEKNGAIEKIRLKGFPTSFAKALTIEDFEKGNFSLKESRFAALKESLIRNGEFVSMVERTKSLKSGYNKRRVLPNGNTEPWIIEKGVIQNGTR